MTTEVILDGHVTLQANFLSRLSTIRVDGHITDSHQEDGTFAHPFDRIQEAIEVARDGATICIGSGDYSENLDCLGKAVQLIGMDYNEPAPRPYPVIDGNNTGPVISFTQGEGPACILMGLVLTGGNGAVVCRDSSPTLVNCLIVGNQSNGPDSAGVNLINSQATLVNCTVADNLGLGLNLRDSQPLLINTILWGNAPMQMAVVGTSEPDIRYCAIEGGWDSPSVIDIDPLFVRRGDWNDSNSTLWIPGDYHLQSQTGHWDTESQAWITDALSSPCIDAGDPGDTVGFEPEPNGGIINLGAYGGTGQASRSPGNK